MSLIMKKLFTNCAKLLTAKVPLKRKIKIHQIFGASYLQNKPEQEYKQTSLLKLCKKNIHMVKYKKRWWSLFKR